MTDSVDLLQNTTESLAITLEEALAATQQSNAQHGEFSCYYETISDQFQTIARQLDRSAELIVQFWSDIRSIDRNLLDLIDPSRDADLSLVRHRRQEVVRLRYLMQESRADFDRLRSHFDHLRVKPAPPALTDAARDITQACRALERALNVADSHALAILNAYDERFAGLDPAAGD